MMAVLALFVDGTDPNSLDGVTILDISGVRATGMLKGDDDAIPGANGVLLASSRPFAAWSFSLPIMIQGSTEAELEERIDATYAALSGTNGIVALVRRKAATAGPGYVDVATPGRCISWTNWRQYPSDDDGWVTTVDIQYLHAKGAWSGDAGATYTIVP